MGNNKIRANNWQALENAKQAKSWLFAKRKKNQNNNIIKKEIVLHILQVLKGQ